MYTCVFVLYSLMDVLGLMPQELRSAGITLPALFARYYGDKVRRHSKTQVKFGREAKSGVHKYLCRVIT